MKPTHREAVARAMFGWTPSTDHKEIEVIYYGDCPTYISVTTQVAGKYRNQWAALHRGTALKVALKMLETDEYGGHTLTKSYR